MNILIGTAVLWGLALWMLRKMQGQTAEDRAAMWTRSKATVIFMLPRIFVGLLGAGFLAVLLPVDQIERNFGTESGLMGITLATIFGLITPGGPFVAYAIGAAAMKAGATLAPLMAYVTAWSIVNLNRSIAYELPLMGRHFLMLRTILSVPVPMVLGLLVWAFQ